MTALHLETSTLTDRYQTTVPSSVRKRLGLNKGDKLRYLSDAQGRVYLENAETEHRDPALAPFLDLLERDIAQNPAKLAPLDPELMARIRALTDGVELGDIDAPLSPDDD
jgi:antitoxin PrlF